MLNGGVGRNTRLIVGATAVGLLAASVLAASPTAADGGLVANAPRPTVQVGPGRRAPTPNWRASALAGSNSTAYFYNWSGYVAQAAQPFTVVRSTYKQPAVTCPVANAYTVFWVGFDGYTDGTVEQGGTLAHCNGTTPVYASWWEMFPTNNINPVFTVAPGDTITAIVTFHGGVYQMTVNDLTSGRHFTHQAMCATGLTCHRDSAEWIVERPGTGGTTYYPLADWGTINLHGDQAATGGGAPQPVTAFSATAIDMVNLADTHYLAQVGALNAVGKSFLDRWDNAQ